MSAYAYVTANQKITDKPCILYSIIVGNDGTNVGWLDVFDASNVDAAHKVGRLYGDGKKSSLHH